MGGWAGKLLFAAMVSAPVSRPALNGSAPLFLFKSIVRQVRVIICNRLPCGRRRLRGRRFLVSHPCARHSKKQVLRLRCAQNGCKDGAPHLCGEAKGGQPSPLSGRNPAIFEFCPVSR